jgi:hypothetical protein
MKCDNAACFWYPFDRRFVLWLAVLVVVWLGTWAGKGLHVTVRSAVLHECVAKLCCAKSVGNRLAERLKQP